MAEPSVNRTEFEPSDVKDVEIKVSSMVSTLMKRVEQVSGLRFRNIILSGSAAEGLKVNKIDEFDFLLELDQQFIVEESDEFPDGFVRILCKNDSDINFEVARPLAWKKKLYRALCQIHGENRTSMHIDGAAVTLTITGYEIPGCPYRNEIDIDFVLALKANASYWPSCAREWLSKDHRFSNEISQDLSNCAIYFVPKFEGMKRLWRISFSDVEKKILEKFTDVQKCCYRMLKIVRDDVVAYQRDRIDHQNKFAHFKKAVTSYHLKTLCFHQYEATLKMSPLQTMKHLLRRLVDAIEAKSIAHYFISSINLLKQFEDKDFREAYDLAVEKYHELCSTVLPYLNDLEINLEARIDDLMSRTSLGETVHLLNPPSSDLRPSWGYYSLADDRVIYN